MFNFGVWLSLYYTDENGKRKFHDDVEFVVNDYQDDVDCDNVNTLLNTAADAICDYAELKVVCTGVEHNGFLIGSFKRIRTRSKNGDSNFRWIVVE